MLDFEGGGYLAVELTSPQDGLRLPIRAHQLARGARIPPNGWVSHSEVSGRKLEFARGVEGVNIQRLRGNLVAHVELLGDLVEQKRVVLPLESKG